MHSVVYDVLKVLGVMALVVVVLAVFAFILIWVGAAHALPLTLVLLLVIGWTIYAFLRYRQARQEELLQVIATAVESDLPLGPAIRAYIHDRPHEGAGGA